LLVTQLRDATLLLQYLLPLPCDCLAPCQLLPIVKSATVLILPPIIVVVVRTIGTVAPRIRLPATKCFLLLLLYASLLQNLALLNLLLTAKLFGMLLLLNALLLLILQDALAIPLPTFLLLFLVLQDAPAILLPTFLLFRTLLLLVLLRTLTHLNCALVGDALLGCCRTLPL
jgi:hypothetical protein